MEWCCQNVLVFSAIGEEFALQPEVESELLLEQKGCINVMEPTVFQINWSTGNKITIWIGEIEFKCNQINFRWPKEMHIKRQKNSVPKMTTKSGMPRVKILWDFILSEIHLSDWSAVSGKTLQKILDFLFSYIFLLS